LLVRLYDKEIHKSSSKKYMLEDSEGEEPCNIDVAARGGVVEFYY